jgi:hypothetical protein
MELQSAVGASCASPDWAIHIAPDNILKISTNSVELSFILAMTPLPAPPISI